MVFVSCLSMFRSLKSVHNSYVLNRVQLDSMLITYHDLNKERLHLFGSNLKKAYIKEQKDKCKKD